MKMTSRWLAAILGGAMLSIILSAQTPAPHRECAGLTSLTLPDIKIGEAVAVPAATSGEIRAAHCRVTGVIGTEIRFSLLLPDTWNGKFMMGGGGGFVGMIDNQANTTVNDGYATVGTDTGHQGEMFDAGWALDNLERQVNFGYVAVHRTAETAKAILRHYYGATEKHSYFSGCSNGGRQGLMEAQRFPDDFDGIVVGAPALDFVGMAAQFVKDMQAVFPDPRNLSAPMFTPETLKSVEAQIVEKCDAVDGVKDGLLEDPRRCNVDVAGLAGLSDGQRAALKKIYAETSGKEGAIYPARPVGGEGEVDGWPAWITGGSRYATPPGPKSGLRIGHAVLQVPRVQRSLLGLQRLRRRERAQGREARCDVHERDQSGSRRVQGERPQADRVARMVGRGADGARQHQVLRTGPGSATLACATTSACS